MYTLSGSPDAVLPALAVADFGGVAINFSGVTTGDAVLIGPEGTISGASAVARFLSRCSGTSAAGRGGFEAAKVSARGQAARVAVPRWPRPPNFPRHRARLFAPLPRRLQFDAWVSFAFEQLMSAPVAAVFDKSRAMLAALVNNGIRYSPSQGKVSHSSRKANGRRVHWPHSLTCPTSSLAASPHRCPTLLRADPTRSFAPT